MTMKRCTQCGRNYTDIMMQCPACEADLIKIQNTQSDQDTEKFSSQQILEERQQIEAMQQRLKLQQQELKEEQQRLEEQRKLDEKRRFQEEQQRLKRERQEFEEERRKFEEKQKKHKRNRKRVIIPLVPASVVIIALGVVTLYNRPWEIISALPQKQSSETVTESEMSTIAESATMTLTAEEAATEEVTTEEPTVVEPLTEVPSIFPLSLSNPEYLATLRDTISAGIWHTVGLKSDGTVIVVGDNSADQCDVSNWSNIKLPSTIR